MRSRNIASLELVTPDKVQVGEDIESLCTAYDRDGSTLGFSDAALADVDIVLKSSVDIVGMDVSSKGTLSQVGYKVTGQHVGDTTLSCALTLPGGKLVSKPKNVQVFSPLQLSPKHLVLIVGSPYQVHS